MNTRTPEEEEKIRSAWEGIFKRLDAEKPPVDPNWKCGRCGRCRDGDFANCKNRQYL